MVMFYPALPLSDVDSLKIVKRNVDGMAVLFARDSQGAVFAFENNCSHADKPLERGVWNPQTAEILCPFHKAVFDVRHAGKVKAGPAVVSLQVFPLEIRMHAGVETVFVGLDNED
ncbi:MAG: Rieske (2Fe-2S) protein [Proteobacteria bacterium]|nr:Rieske (2Fe-2S) protein [Pseudomonadota bacterium]